MVLKEVMESINPDIKFVMELEEDFPDLKLPTLDTRVWLEKSQDSAQPPQFNFSFYEKPMKSRYVVLEKSAMSYKQKVAILGQEVVRRMLNSKIGISQQERKSVLDKFSEKLFRSGYNLLQVREILTSGIRGYQNKLEKAGNLNEKLYRSAKCSLAERIKKKVFEKTSWYKPRRDMNKPGYKSSATGRKTKKESGKARPPPQIKSVLFVPRTEGGELLQRLREEERKLADISGYRVKLVERPGTQISRILCQRNPWAGDDCGRPDCLVCGDGEEGGGDCRRRNITYINTCITCLNRRKAGVPGGGAETGVGSGVARYIGESGRSGYERGLEHMEGLRKGQEDSHMFKHKLMEHPDEEVNFRMKILKKHKSAFERQVTEAVLIEMEDNGLLLNSKGGFNRCVLPRLQVVMGDKLVENEEREEKLTNYDEILTSRQTEEKRKDSSRLTGDLSPPNKNNKRTKRDTNLREEGVKERLDRERERREKEMSDGEKEAKVKTSRARKTKVPKLNDKLPPNFDFIPISRVFSVKPKTSVGQSDNWGSRPRYKRKPGEGVALS